MNERITKIVIDTLGKEGVVNSRAFGHWALSDEELEKFAELIVKECASLCLDMKTILHPQPHHYAVMIKEHFGVEE